MRTGVVWKEESSFLHSPAQVTKEADVTCPAEKGMANIDKNNGLYKL